MFSSSAAPISNSLRLRLRLGSPCIFSLKSAICDPVTHCCIQYLNILLNCYFNFKRNVKVALKIFFVKVFLLIRMAFTWPRFSKLIRHGCDFQGSSGVSRLSKGFSSVQFILLILSTKSLSYSSLLLQRGKRQPNLSVTRKYVGRRINLYQIEIHSFFLMLFIDYSFSSFLVYAVFHEVQARNNAVPAADTNKHQIHKCTASAGPSYCWSCSSLYRWSDVRWWKCRWMEEKGLHLQLVQMTNVEPAIAAFYGIILFVYL